MTRTNDAGLGWFFAVLNLLRFLIGLLVTFFLCKIRIQKQNKKLKTDGRRINKTCRILAFSYFLGIYILSMIYHLHFLFFFFYISLLFFLQDTYSNVRKLKKKHARKADGRVT